MHTRRLAHSLSIAAGIVICCWIARHVTPDWTLLAPFTLALSIVAASALDAAGRGRRARASAAAWIMAGALLLACQLLTQGDARSMAEMLPVLGISAWAALLPDDTRRRAQCRRRVQQGQ